MLLTGAVRLLLFLFSDSLDYPTLNGTTTNEGILGFWATAPKVLVLESESQMQETILFVGLNH